MKQKVNLKRTKKNNKLPLILSETKLFFFVSRLDIKANFQILDSYLTTAVLPQTRTKSHELFDLVLFVFVFDNSESMIAQHSIII